MVHADVLFTLFCTVNWLDVDELNIEVGANKWGGGSAPAYPLTLTTERNI